MEKKTVRYNKEELKKLKSKTNWAKLVQDDKSPDKKIKPTQKPRG